MRIEHDGRHAQHEPGRVGPNAIVAARFRVEHIGQHIGHGVRVHAGDGIERPVCRADEAITGMQAVQFQRERALSIENEQAAQVGRKPCFGQRADDAGSLTRAGRSQHAQVRGQVRYRQTYRQAGFGRGQRVAALREQAGTLPSSMNGLASLRALSSCALRAAS